MRKFWKHVSLFRMQISIYFALNSWKKYELFLMSKFSFVSDNAASPVNAGPKWLKKQQLKNANHHQRNHLEIQTIPLHSFQEDIHTLHHLTSKTSSCPQNWSTLCKMIRKKRARVWLQNPPKTVPRNSFINICLKPSDKVHLCDQ